ncbi:putative transporter subunit: ATP-binding component of ABC superfamily [Desulforamulus hydrothermalis Lam5 = DSM 18033]|uniref:Putative transporter subunit: ATP-binding component of ABC superfamily n=2 Tax=Desulforamulus TaxID=2916693 RepID=K8EHN8_9FIRM|nr:putative transporter subunit: ATP-binding component of ABC superfamily [Desulforamulus hydrothermalis Lam5 = DSM 18033]
MRNMIKVSNLTKIYHTGTVAVQALKGITVSVQKGEFVAVMGPSGSGKSTFMNLLGLLDTATEGTYILEGKEVSALNKNQLAVLRNQKLGFVFQAFNLIPGLTALKNVELPMLYAGIKPKERTRRALLALQRVGLGDRVHHRPHELSGGQNQRVAIARALVNKPAVIMADEPTGALDTQTGEEIMAIFQQLHREGATIVLVTHEPDIARYAERILRFKDGRLISDELVENRIVSSEKTR